MSANEKDQIWNAPSWVRACVFDTARIARPGEPRFVVIRTSDRETIAATNDLEAARAVVRLLSF